MNISIFANDSASAKHIATHLGSNKGCKILYSGNEIAKFLASKKCLLTKVLIMDYIDGKHDLKVMLSRIRRINERILTVFIVPDGAKVNWNELVSIGANGFVESGLESSLFYNYLESLVLNGGFISPRIAADILNYFRTKESTNEMMLLPKKSHKVLAYLSEGLKYEEIAREMNTSINSVRYYIKQIYTILNVDNKGGAISIYMKGNVKLK
ncbi:MAG: response regulator transcription factor [Saprospiraceae bacterium]|nr:response regulator transcription factor [Saprospiraceae bacterium]